MGINPETNPDSSCMHGEEKMLCDAVWLPLLNSNWTTSPTLATVFCGKKSVSLVGSPAVTTCTTSWDMVLVREYELSYSSRDSKQRKGRQNWLV